MDTDKQPLKGPSPDSLGAGYETSSVNVGGLAWFVVALVVSALITFPAVLLIKAEFLHLDEGKNKPASALTQLGKDGKPLYQVPPPPAPRIQPSQPDDAYHNPPVDLKLMLEKEDRIFQKLGWEMDEQTHAQKRIPENVVDQVVSELRQRQQASGAAPAARTNNGAPVAAR